MDRPRVTRTAHQLPFLELEPHRFEDLGRELLHRFRTMRSVEAIGRSGGEQGVDVRAHEAVPGSGDRLWYVQLKRKQSVGPSEVERIVDEAVAAGGDVVPWGFLLIAPVNFSRESQDLAKRVLSQRGVSEVYLWGRGELEDLLYLESNRNLLEKYFDLAGGNRNERSEAYRHWLSVAESWATWAYEPGASFGKFQRELHDVMTEIHLVAPSSVRTAVQAYIDHLDENLIASIGDAVAGISDPTGQAAASGVAYARAMQPHRDAVLVAMREDVGNTF